MLLTITGTPRQVGCRRFGFSFRAHVKRCGDEKAKDKSNNKSYERYHSSSLCGWFRLSVAGIIRKYSVSDNPSV
jgi:hypothetical protein